MGSIPKAVVSRLSLYLRELQHLVRDGYETTSSNQLGRKLGFTDAQVRKDLAFFGHFGYPGVGYRCAELIAAIRRILGTDKQWSAALVGVGNLGRALLGYKGFQQQNFRIAAAFDTDPTRIGTTIEGVQVYSLESLPEVARALRMRLGIIAVPAAAAQIVADRLVAAGIEGVLNFAPLTIRLPEGVQQVGVDLAIELEQLSFAVMNRSEVGDPDSSDPDSSDPDSSDPDSSDPDSSDSDAGDPDSSDPDSSDPDSSNPDTGQADPAGNGDVDAGETDDVESGEGGQPDGESPEGDMGGGA